MPLPSVRAFDHVLIVMFENQYRGYVLRNPYMRGLARRGIDLAGFFGVMHPSQTNYIASIAGELCDVTGDDPVSPLLSGRTIVDLIEEAPGGLSWRAYMESYVAKAQPWTPTLAPGDMPPYYVKHNPFGSFASVVRNEARWQRVDGEAALFADLLDGTFPEYAWLSPNVWSDGHWIDGTQDESDPRAPELVDQAARWLEGFFGRLRFPGPGSFLPPRTLVVILFDEADYEAEWDRADASTYDGPNQVYAVLLGDMIQPGVEHEAYNHYSLLRTIEVNFGLGSLGKNDAGASWFQFLWGRHFRWGAPAVTPIHAAEAVAAAGFAGALEVVYTARGGALRTRTLASNGWSEERAIDGTAGALALASAGEHLLLVTRDAGGGLSSRAYSLDHGWPSETEAVASGPVGAFAVAAMPDGTEVMLVWRADDDTLQSRLWSSGKWREQVPVAGFSGDGALALSTLGASLYLVIELRRAGRLDLMSYNTAPFNVVTPPGAPQDSTTVNAWSPCAFPVAHFSARPEPCTPGEPEPRAQAYRARGPLAAATLDGVLHLVFGGIENPLLFTATFSLAGLMTPLRPVSTRPSNSHATDTDHEQPLTPASLHGTGHGHQSRGKGGPAEGGGKGVALPTSSNGYGTPAEAGWGRPAPMHGAFCPPGGAVAMGAWERALAVLFQPEAGGPVRLALGRHEENPTRRL